ncbi:MAG TPA: hypothetical protein VJB02_04030, partial [Coxiellaceae bacterium]|nr:hypothetical protein [Coxiellaceae bacterium]
SLSSRVLEVPASAVGAGSGGGGTPPRSSQASRDAATHLSPSRGLIPGEGGSGESAGAGSEASAHSIASAASTALPSPAVSEEAEEDRPSSRERELECCGGERRGQLRDPSTEGLMDALTLAAGGRAECRREGINPSPTAALRAPPFPRSVSADNLQLQPEAAQKLREDAADTAAAAMAAAHRAPRPMVSSCRPVGALR